MKNEPADWDDVKKRINEQHIEEGDCWIWTGHAAKGSVPMVRYKSTEGKSVSVSARKMSAIIAGRTVRDGKVCVPSCGEPLCVNPEHVKILTSNDFLSRISKIGTSGVANIRRAAKISETRRAKHAKLTQEDVQQIRESNLSQRELGKIFGICQDRVSKIKRGAAWKNHSATPFSGLIRAA